MQINILKRNFTKILPIIDMQAGGPESSMSNNKPLNAISVDVRGQSVQVSIEQADIDDILVDASIDMRALARVNDEGDVIRSDDTYIALFRPAQFIAETMGSLSSSIVKALGLAAGEARKSVAIMLDDDKVETLGLVRSDIIDSVFEGVAQYLKLAREDASQAGITDIVLAAGKAMYLAWMMEVTDIRQKLGALAREPKTALALPSPSGLSQEPPANLVGRWLAKIGEEFARLGDEEKIRFYRNNGHMSPNADMIVVFNAASGEPISISRGFSVPEPSALDPGTAAVHISTYDMNGTPAIRVYPELAMSDAAPSNAALAVVAAIHGRIPTPPQASADVMEMADGSRLASVDASIHEANAKFMQKLRRAEAPSAMTVNWDISIDHKSADALAEWIAERRGGLDARVLSDLILRRFRGMKQYDVTIEPNGKFVGASVHMNSENSPRGTSYEVGFQAEGASFARNIFYQAYEYSGKKEREVPAGFKWIGERGLAHAAFMQWYNQPEFVEARKHLITQEDLTQILFGGDDPKRRASAMVDYLVKNADARAAIADLYSTVHTLEDRQIAPMLNRIDGAVNRKTAMRPETEAQVAFIEMLMRETLGDKAVDRILANDRNPLPPTGGGNGGAKQLPPTSGFSPPMPVPSAGNLPFLGIHAAFPMTTMPGVTITPIVPIGVR